MSRKPLAANTVKPVLHQFVQHVLNDTLTMYSVYQTIHLVTYTRCRFGVQSTH